MDAFLIASLALNIVSAPAAAVLLERGRHHKRRAADWKRWHGGAEASYHRTIRELATAREDLRSANQANAALHSRAVVAETELGQIYAKRDANLAKANEANRARNAEKLALKAAAK